MLDGRERGHRPMRAFLGIAALCFGVSGIAAASAQTLSADNTVIRTLKGDRLAAPPPVEAVRADSTAEARSAFASANIAEVPAAQAEETPAPVADSVPAETPTAVVHRIPLDEFCDMIISSARANDLPIVFFTNLIWQESRFNPNSVSHTGAQGVAQFMPETAAANGLDNPFNPFQAVPASARLLRQLQEQFGNVGLAAAAYNAGPGRVIKWLAKHASLPRETRAYVATITGRPAEQWRAAEPTMSFRPARDLPCSRTPAFAELQEAQIEPASEPAPANAAKSVPTRVIAARIGPAKPRARLAVHGTVKITSKPVQLTLVATESSVKAAHRPKPANASQAKNRKSRHVRLASTTP